MIELSKALGLLFAAGALGAVASLLVGILAVALFTELLVAPIVGIRRASKRRQERRRSRGPIAFASFNVALLFTAALLKLLTWDYWLLVVLNCAWLWMSVSASRFARASTERLQRAE